MATAFHSSLGSLLLSLAEPGVLRSLLANQDLRGRSRELTKLTKTVAPSCVAMPLKVPKEAFGSKVSI